MAVTIINQPSYPNVTHTNLIYEVSSDKAGQAQFQYVMDVRLGATLLARIKQYPNPQGKGVFDPSKIFNDYLEYDETIIETFLTTTFGASDRTFNVFFGEQYSDNFTNPTTLYTGAGVTVGDPSIAGVNARVFPGTVDPNNGTSFNWLDINTSPKYLTNHPLRPNDIEDYHCLNKNTDAIVGQYGGGQVYYYLVNAAGSNIATINMGVQDTLTYIPVGGQNMLGRGIAQSILDNTVTSYLTLGNSDYRYYFYWKPDCHYDTTNFIFINKYGAWDNFTVTLPTDKQTRITRDELKRPFVNYSNDGAYNLQRRGRDYYNLDFLDSYVVSSNWLSQGQAEWLTEMLESPKVFIQNNGGGVTPIVITNSSYTSFTNKKAQKTFEFEIEYQYANARRSVS
tara:strand:- start:8123 stop:9307 length:1185 start_codon:yes stop_codon:yes gene_type:complete